MPPPNPKNFTYAAAADLGLADASVGEAEMDDEEAKKKKMLQKQRLQMGGDGTAVFGDTGLGAAMMLFNGVG